MGDEVALGLIGGKMNQVENNLVVLKKLHEKLLHNGFSSLMEETNEKITFCYEARCGDIFHKVDKNYEQRWFNIDIVQDKNNPRMTQITIGVCTLREFDYKTMVTLMNGVTSLSGLVPNSFEDLDSLLLVGRKLLNASMIVES